MNNAWNEIAENREICRGYMKRALQDAGCGYKGIEAAVQELNRLFHRMDPRTAHDIGDF